MQLDSPLPEESYQQYHQLKGHLTLHAITTKGVVGEHILNTHPQQKCFKCNRRGHYSSQYQSTTVVMISAEPRQFLTEHIHQHYADTSYILEYSGEH